MSRLLIAIFILHLFLARFVHSQKPELVVPIGHILGINSVVFSPDGRYVLSGSYDEIVKLWEVSSGRLLRSFVGHTDRVLSVAFSADGRYVLSGSDDKTVKLWEVGTGKLIRTLEGHRSSVYSVAFSSNGRYILSGSWDNTVKIWKVSTGKLLRTFKGHSKGANSSAFSPDARYVLSASDDGMVRFWDIGTGKLIKTLEGHTEGCNSVAFSPDARYVLSASNDGMVRIWEVGTGKLLRTLQGYTLNVKSVAFSPNGRYVLSASDDGTVRIWEVGTGKLIKTLEGHTERCNSVAFSPDACYVLSASNDKTVKLWEVSTGKLLRTLQGYTLNVNSVAFSPDGRYALSGSDDNSVKLWEVSKSKLLQTLQGHSSRVFSVAFSSDSRYALSGSDDTSVKLWEISTGKLVKTLEGHSRGVKSVAFSPDGQYALSGSDDTSVKLWEISTGKLVKTLEGHSRGVKSVAFSPDGHYALSGSFDDTVKLWEVGTGKLIKTLVGRTYGFSSVVFSPDGRYGLLGSYDGTVRLWEVGTGKLIKALEGHTYGVSSVAFSSDGQYVMSGSWDTSIKLWNAVTGKELGTLIAVDSTDWVVTTPSGLFDASPGAMKLMHYVVNDSTDHNEPWKVIEFEQLKQRYYQPGLLSILVGFSKEPLRQVPTFEGVNLPPGIELSLKGDELTVKLYNRKGGIGPVSVFINGAEVVEDLRTNPKRDVSQNALILTLPLIRFANRYDTLNSIRVVATNGEGWLSSRPAEINYRPTVRTRGGEPERSPSSAAKTIRLRAVVVGTSNIGLRFAHSDAEQIANSLRLAATELLGSANGSVQLLVTKPSGVIQSNKAQIIKALVEAQQTHPEDIFILHLSGHAVNYGGQDGDLYYLTAGATSADANYINDPAIRQTYALSSQELTHYLNQIPARKKLLILDVCSAGKGAEKLLLAARDVPASQIRALDRLQERTGFYVLAGSAADAVSYEANVYGQGLLTYTLLKGIKGAALRREGTDEFVDVEKWLGYAVEQVPLLAKDIGGIQQPFYRGTQNQRSFDVGRITESIKAKIHIAEPKPVLLVKSFQEDAQFDDVLELKNKVESALNDLIAARGADAPMLTMEAKDYPGAYTLNGRYTLRGEIISVSCKVFRASVLIGEFVVSGTKSKLSDLARLVLERAQRLVTQ